MLASKGGKIMQMSNILQYFVTDMIRFMPMSILLMTCILMNHSMHKEASVLYWFQSIEANNQSGQQRAAFGPNTVTQ